MDLLVSEKDRAEHEKEALAVQVAEQRAALEAAADIETARHAEAIAALEGSHRGTKSRAPVCVRACVCVCVCVCVFVWRVGGRCAFPPPLVVLFSYVFVDRFFATAGWW